MAPCCLGKWKPVQAICLRWLTRSNDTSKKGLKGWSGHSCLLTYIKPEHRNPVSGHATTRRPLPHWQYDGAIYWITSVCIPAEGPLEGQTGMSTPPSHTFPRRQDKPLCGGGADGLANKAANRDNSRIDQAKPCCWTDQREQPPSPQTVAGVRNYGSGHALK